MSTRMHFLSKKGMLVILILVSVTILLSFLFNPTVRKYCCATEYKTFTSPNGEYHIIVYRIKVFPMMMPGSAADAPGFVKLYNRNNNVIYEKNVDMVQLIDDVK